VECDVSCEWRDVPPRYRAWVGTELFTERSWIWDDVMLQESFQIKAVTGAYPMRYECVDPAYGEISVRNWRVAHGPAKINQQGLLEISA